VELTNEYSLSLNDWHNKGYTGTVQYFPDNCPKWAQCPISNNDFTLAHGAKGGTSQFLFPDHRPKWAQCPISNNDFTLAHGAKGRKRDSFLRLTFSPNETLFIPINRHVTWKFPFSSGVSIGYCLRNCLVIGWFKCFQDLQVNLGTRGFTWSWPGVMWFHLCLVTCLVTLLTF